MSVGGHADGTVPDDEKGAITRACARFLDDVLRPRWLPEIRPTPFNYPISLDGKWYGNKYRFITHYRSGHAENFGDEFDAPFARLEYLGRDRFDVSYFRHTEEWFRLYRDVRLAVALQWIATDELLQPP
jgi:hypothetical protein